MTHQHPFQRRMSALTFIGLAALFLFSSCNGLASLNPDLAIIEEEASESASDTFELEGEISITGGGEGLIYATLPHNGIEREFIVYVPEGYSRSDPTPLVLNLHGFTGTAESQLNYADFRPIADREGFLLVYPQGTLLDGDTHWNVGGWTRGSTADDIGFLNYLIDALATEFNIDFARIYSTGHSNGGYMSYQLACQPDSTIAAVASVSGSMTPEIANNCAPGHPTPILQVHGTSDTVVPYGGSSWTRSIEDVLEYWVDFNGIGSEPTITEIPENPDSTAGTSIEVIRFGDPEFGLTVEHIRVIGGGHEWLNNFDARGRRNLDLDTNEAIWAFFDQYDIYGARVDASE